VEGIEMKGVKEDPYFDIPVDCHVLGTHHLKLGNINNAVDYVVDFADKMFSRYLKKNTN
jgi:hypothetical protein